MKKTLKQKFDGKYEAVTESGCWIWTKKSNKAGYGIITHTDNGNIWYQQATHASLLLHKGIKVPEGSVCCHTCDVPACVNPDHLFVGTQADNMKDKAAKGRSHRMTGEIHPFAKLTNSDVKDMRRLHKKGKTVLALSEDYNVSYAAAWNAINGKTWRI